MKNPERFNPDLGNPNVTPYAMMVSCDTGNWVRYEEYEKLQLENDKLWEDVGGRDLFIQRIE